MTYKEIVISLSEELDIPEEVVDAAYKSFFEFIRTTIGGLPLKDELSKEDFDKLRTNFNIPSLGKLHCTYERYKGMKERMNYLKKLQEEYEDKED